MGPPDGILALPGPAFSYDYARGALAVHGVPLTVHQDGGQARRHFSILSPCAS